MALGRMQAIRREKMAGRPDKKSVRMGIGHGTTGAIAAQTSEATVCIVVVQVEVGVCTVPEDHQAICANAELAMASEGDILRGQEVICAFST